MCRSIKTLHNFKPPATDEEIRASALQFVRKLSGFTRPSRANQQAFDRAVEEVTHAAHEVLASLVTNAPPRDREVEASKARARAAVSRLMAALVEPVAIRPRDVQLNVWCASAAERAWLRSAGVASKPSDRARG
jgi:hypothetical protein